MNNNYIEIKFIIFTLIILILASACGGGSEPEEPDFLTQGWDRFQQEDYDSSLSLFEKSLANNSSTEGKVGKGWSLLMIDTSSLDEISKQLTSGIGSEEWGYDSRVGLASVEMNQNEYNKALNHVNIVLQDSASYVFRYNSDIDWHDLLVIKSQALFLGKRNYEGAYYTIEKVEPDTSYNLNPDDKETWILDGEEYISFNTIVAEIISIESSKYRSF